MARGRSEFLAEIGNSRVTPVAPVNYHPSIEQDDEQDMLDSPGDEWQAETITGRSYVIEYTGSNGASSTRQILCRRLEKRAQLLYLHAFCYARDRLRCFRGDRIAAIIDPVTGEVHEPGLLLLNQFALESSSASPFRMGLAPRQYADFNAALNVLAFMARCDGHWHDAEAERIEDFAISYWLRSDIEATLDTDEVIRLAKRLAPDAETFWVSLNRCAENATMSRLLRMHVGALIEADGILHEKEAFWGMKIDEHLRG